MSDDIRDLFAFVLDNYQETRLKVANPLNDLPVCSTISMLRDLFVHECA